MLVRSEKVPLRDDEEDLVSRRAKKLIVEKYALALLEYLARIEQKEHGVGTGNVVVRDVGPLRDRSFTPGVSTRRMRASRSGAGYPISRWSTSPVLASPPTAKRRTSESESGGLSPVVATMTASGRRTSGCGGWLPSSA